MSSDTENNFQNVSNNESPSLGERLGIQAPENEQSPEPVPAPEPAPAPEPVPAPAPQPMSPPTPSPEPAPAFMAPEPAALAPARRGMTEGQAELQRQRAITLDMMREEYRKIFGDDKKAPKAKAYDAAGLTTVRLQKGNDAFLRKLHEQIIPRNARVYENKTRKRVAVAKPRQQSPRSREPSPAMPAMTRYERPSNLRAKAEELLRKASALEEEERRKAAEAAAERARREAIQEMRDRAERNLRNAMDGQNVPKDLLDGYVKLLQSEYKKVPAKAFKDICSFCAAHATQRRSGSRRARSLNRRYTRRRSMRG